MFDVVNLNVQLEEPVCSLNYTETCAERSRIEASSETTESDQDDNTNGTIQSAASSTLQWE